MEQRFVKRWPATGDSLVHAESSQHADPELAFYGSGSAERRGSISRSRRRRQEGSIGSLVRKREVLNDATDAVFDFGLGPNQFLFHFLWGQPGKYAVRAAMRSDLDPGGGHLANLMPIQKELSFREEGPGKAHCLDERVDQFLDGTFVTHRFDCLYDRINVTLS